MMINIPAATFGDCHDCLIDGALEDRSVVITPLRVTITNPDSCKVSFGCNFWKSCENKECSYCQAGMDRDRA